MSRAFSRALTPWRGAGWGGTSGWDIDPWTGGGGRTWGVDPWRSSWPVGTVATRPMSQLSLLQDTFSDLDRQFQRLESDMNSMLRQWGLPPRLETAQELGLQPEIVGEGENKRYRLNVHMGENFSPENVKVSLKDRVMTVEAKQEQRSDDGNTRVYQEMSRQFTLPEEVEVKDVKSVLNPDGVLTIEAPIHERALPEPPKPKEIPVLME